MPASAEYNTNTADNGNCQVSNEFRQQLCQAATSRIGEGFLVGEVWPRNWRDVEPFKYGISPKTGGYDCSGLAVASIADVLGKKPVDIWRADCRTSTQMVQATKGGNDYKRGVTDYREAEVGDIIISVSDNYKSLDERWIGSHTMITSAVQSDSFGSLEIIHAGDSLGVSRKILYGQSGRIRVPLGKLLARGLIDPPERL